MNLEYQMLLLGDLKPACPCGYSEATPNPCWCSMLQGTSYFVYIGKWKAFFGEVKITKKQTATICWCQDKILTKSKCELQRVSEMWHNCLDRAADHHLELVLVNSGLWGTENKTMSTWFFVLPPMWGWAVCFLYHWWGAFVFCSTGMH